MQRGYPGGTLARCAALRAMSASSFGSASRQSSTCSRASSASSSLRFSSSFARRPFCAAAKSN